MPKHDCKICSRIYECPFCTPTAIACMGMRYGIFPRLEKTHFICSRNCHNFFIDHFEVIDRTAEIDVTMTDIKNSINRNKKRKLNEEPITREENMKEQTDFRVPDMPLGPVWSSLPCAFGDSSTFFAHHRGLKMFVPQDNQNGPFSLGK